VLENGFKARPVMMSRKPLNERAKLGGDPVKGDRVISLPQVKVRVTPVLADSRLMRKLSVSGVTVRPGLLTTIPAVDMTVGTCHDHAAIHHTSCASFTPTTTLWTIQTRGFAQVFLGSFSDVQFSALMVLEIPVMTTREEQLFARGADQRGACRALHVEVVVAREKLRSACWTRQLNVLFSRSC